MNRIETLHNLLSSQGLEVHLDAPRDPQSTWWLNVYGERQHLEITWSPKDNTFGLSTLDPEGFGQGPDERYTDLSQLQTRVLSLLQSGEHTLDISGMLRDLRERCGLSQQQVAERLGVQQAAVSKLERRDDPSLQSLRRYVESLGGVLEVRATLPATSNAAAVELRLEPFSSPPPATPQLSTAPPPKHPCILQELTVRPFDPREAPQGEDASPLRRVRLHMLAAVQRTPAEPHYHAPAASTAALA